MTWRHVWSEAMPMKTATHRLPLAARRWRVILLALVIGLLAAPLWPGQIGHAGVCPPVQNTQKFTILYGSVTINAAAAPAGATVQARSPRGDTVGCQLTQDGGEYPLMYVYGEQTLSGITLPGMRNGEAIQILVAGVPATSTPVQVWANDWSSHQVNLAATVAAPPPTVANVQTRIVGGQLLLTWPDVGATADHYEVWRASTPYFTPGADGSQRIAAAVPPNPGGAVSFPDPTSHLGDAGINDYYMVLAVNILGQASAASNRTGEFDFALTSGN